jgi:hypothetical protein
MRDAGVRIVIRDVAEDESAREGYPPDATL